MSVCEHIHLTCARVCVDTQESFLTKNNTELQALVYNILPPTTAITGYATVSENCQFFHWSSNGNMFVTDNSNYIRNCHYNCPHCLLLHKQNKNCLNWNGTNLFTRHRCASYSCACFDTMLLPVLFIPRPFRRHWRRWWLDRCAQIRNTPSVVWLIMSEFGGKAPESEVWSVNQHNNATSFCMTIILVIHLLH